MREQLRSETLFLLLSTLLSISIGLALSLADFSGQVVSVLDGDTIEVLHNQRPERIRLNGINCPEKDQAYGQRASKPHQTSPLGKKSPSRPTA